MRYLWLLSLVAVSLTAPAQTRISPRNSFDQAFERLQAQQPGVRFVGPERHFERLYGPAFGGGTTADDAFETFMQAYGGIFSPGDSRFVFQGQQDLMLGKFLTGTYEQYWGKYPVDGGRVTLLARNELGFPLVLAVNSAKTLNGAPPAPRISSNAAISVLRMAHPSLDEFEKPELVIWMGETNGHLAWSFHASGKKTQPDCADCGPIPEKVLAFVDAVNGQVLEERQAIWTVDVSGNVSGWATPGLKPDQANNPPTLQPLKNLRANITGGNFAFTNNAGDYTIANGGSSAITVNAPLTGRWVNVINSAGTTLTMSQSVTPPGPADFIYNPAPSQFTTSQINGLVQTNLIHDFVKSVNPTYPGIDIVLPCNVNVAGSCNAFFTTSGGPSINFYQASTTPNSCPNMAYSTVVWHEYGHFVIYRGGTAQGGYGEGMADTIANLCGDTPWTGEDFRGPNTGPLRSAINSVTYPSPTEAHTAGQIVSGAFWGTLTQLDPSMGHGPALNLVRQLAINSILLHPPTISPGMTVDVLTLDDNDADISNGTPHYAQIAAGFGAKGLPAPPVQWVKWTSVTREPNFIPYAFWSRTIRTVFTVESNAGTLDPATIKLFYRENNGGWVSNSLPLLAQNAVVAQIPLSNPGTYVEWYLEAKDTQGRATRTPLFAPDQTLAYVVANDLVTVVEDTLVSDLGWTVSNTNVAAGAWLRGDPNSSNLNGFVANPGDDSDDPGAQCFFTGQGAIGGAVGDADVDGGPTRLTSPAYDLSGFDAIVEYKRWFFNDDGDDALTVEVSNDNGATWKTVETVVGIQNSWVKRTFRLGAFVSGTAQVRLRFSVTDEPNNSITEAAIDHIVIKKMVL